MINANIDRLYPSLTPEQRKVISHISGPLLVVAGPGSGKSLTLILRAINLIALGYARPRDIVISTFSRGAAQELNDRFATASRAVGGDADWCDTQITTIHGFCQSLLREHGRHIISPGFSVLDDLGRLAFIDSRLYDITTKAQREQFFGHWRSPANSVRGLARAFDQIVDLSVAPQDLVFAENRLHGAIGSVYLEYQSALKDCSLADFSHLLQWAHDLLIDPEMEQIRSERSYALVDEYQDSNRLQEKIFRLWTARSENLMVVGDDDQSIYGFRGARPNNISSFADCVPGCKIIQLATNFRSHNGIVTVSSNWMREISGTAGDRCAKDLASSSHRVHADYPSVVAVDGSTPEDEADQLARLFCHLKRDEVVADYNQIALLLHSVRDDVIRPYMEALQAHGIPHMVRRQERFFDRPEVRHMVGCLAVIFDGLTESGDASYPVANPFHRYLRAAAKSVWAGTPSDSALYRALIRWPDQIREAVGIGATLERSLHDYFYALLSVSPFSEDQRDPVSTQYMALWSRCIEVFHAQYGHRQISGKQVCALKHDLFDRFLPLLYQDPGWQRVVETESATPGHVQILTVHQSKGREFPVAAVGSLAHNPAVGKTGLDFSVYSPDHEVEAGEAPDMMEPARCKYTAFTRAEHLLVLTGHGKPSPTLKHLWQSLPRWSGRTHRALSKQRFPLERPTVQRPIYSVTGDLAQYERCPRRYRYFGKYGFVEPRTSSSVIGGIVHDSIDAIHQDVLRGGSVGERRMREIVAEQSKFAGSSLAPDEKHPAATVALQQVIRYVQANRGVFGSILASELALQTDEGDFILKGRADLLAENGGVLEITDFKTGSRAAWNSERTLEHERQLMLYAYMAEQRLGRPVSRARIYWTAEHTAERAVESIEVNDRRISEAREQSALTAEAIRAGDFTVGHPPSLEVCCSCPLHTLCRRDGTIEDPRNQIGVRSPQAANWRKTRHG